MRVIGGCLAVLVAVATAAPSPLDCPVGTQRRASATEEYCVSPGGRREGPWRELGKNGAVRREGKLRDGKNVEMRCFTPRGNPVKCVSDGGELDTFVDAVVEFDAAGRKAERVRAEKQTEAYCDLEEKHAKLEEEYDDKCVPWFYPDEPISAPCARVIAKRYEQSLAGLERQIEAARKKLESRDAVLTRFVEAARACHCPTQTEDSNYRAGVVRRMRRGSCRQ